MDNDKNMNIALQASAGTGKTFQLSMRVVRMLLSGVSPSDILCLTFTNKATDEMVERILSLLEALAQNNAGDAERSIIEPFVQKIAQKQNVEYSEKFLQNLAKARRDKLLEEYSSLKIRTFHSFFNTILKLFPFEADLRPDFKIVTDGGEQETAKRKAFYEVIETLLKEGAWENIFQKTAEVFEVNSLKVIDELVYRFADYSSQRMIILQNNENFRKIDAKIIEETLEKTSELRKNILNDMKSFAEKILTDNSLKDRMRSALENLISNKIKDIISQTSVQNGIDNHGYFKKYEFNQADLASFYEIRENIKEFIRLKAIIAEYLSLKIGKLFYDNFKKIKLQGNILTPDDITEKVYEMLAGEDEKINKDYLYFRLDGKINHILIDEFQDTSNAQWLVMKPLAEEAMAGLSQNDKSGSFFYVGDQKQNLYRFRGGSAVLFDMVAENYQDKIKLDTLKTNYRSGANIVETVNEIFSAAYKSYENIEQLKIFEIDQRAAEKNGIGYVLIEELPKDGDRNKNHIEFTIKNIKKLHDENNISYSDIAVLTSTNKEGVTLKEALSEEKIPVRLETSRGLSNTPIFKCIMALVDFIETKNEFAFAEYSLTEVFALSPDKFAEVGFRKSTEAHILKIADKKRDKPIFEKLLAVVCECDIQRRFKDEPDFFQTLDLISSAAPDEKNYALFKEAVGKNVGDINSITGEKISAVTIMTVHKSKGLEFPAVIIPNPDYSLATNANKTQFIMQENQDMSSADIKYLHNKSTQALLDEEYLYAVEKENALILQDSLNKLYVGLTRAKNILMVATPQLGEKKAGGEISNVNKLIGCLVELPYEKGEIKCAVPEKKQAASDEKYIAVEKSAEGNKTFFEREVHQDFAASNFGDALHYAAFLLNSDKLDDVAYATNKTISRYGALFSEKEKSSLSDFVKKLAANEDWCELLSGDIYRERKFATEIGELVSIDIYSVFKDKIILCDYKTGKESQESYKEQLSKYEKVLRRKYGEMKIIKKIFYFSGSEIEVINY